MSTTEISNAGKDAFDAAYQAAYDQGLAESTMAERARLGAIISSEEFAGREAAAHVLMFETEMSAEAAIKLLATMAREEPKPAASLPTGRSKDAAGGLVIAEGHGLQVTDDFERGRTIIRGMH